MTEARRLPAGTAAPRTAARVYRLGEEPTDDLSASTTPEERLAMVWELTARAWTLTARPVPSYERHHMPIARRRLV
jgi:hypothetical protein